MTECSFQENTGELKVKSDLCSKNHYVETSKKEICHIVQSKPRLIIDPVILNIRSWNLMMFHPNAIVGLLSF